MEKSYYQQLKPVVLSYVEHFKTDFTVHDKKSLRGYKGEFYYGIRKTGTDIFLYTRAGNALLNLINKKETDYFTSRGLRNIYDGVIDFAQNHWLIYVLLERYQNDRFFIGKDDEVKEVSKEEFDRQLRAKVKILNDLAALLKGKPFILNLSQKLHKQEEEERRQRDAA